MKIAIVGSRGLCVEDIGKYLPCGITEIISGGARGIDTQAREYARANGIRLTEILPEYEKYGRAAPLRRNLRIIDSADEVLALWDGHSSGTRYVIEQCKKRGKKVSVYTLNESCGTD